MTLICSAERSMRSRISSEQHSCSMFEFVKLTMETGAGFVECGKADVLFYGSPIFEVDKKVSVCCSSPIANTVKAKRAILVLNIYHPFS